MDNISEGCMAEREHLSLQKLQGVIKSRLEDAIPLPVWVAAEISELKVNYSGHCYLELVEKGGDNQVPSARASAVIWRSTFGAVDSYFRSTTGAALSPGMKVLLRVAVNYHELYGLSLVVSDIDPLYTLGDMERQRQQTILRLQEDGVYDMNRSLDLPPVIQRIAVVSSRNAAGYQDFVNELTGGGFRFDVTLFDAFMQGNGAEESIIDALGAVADTLDEFDVVVMIRGGGSQSDLAAFDSYRLCSHIAQFPVPVVTGIGHDKDQSVADLVAAVSLKTPTAVATWLVNGLVEFEQWLDTLHGEVVEAGVSVLEGERRRLQNAAFGLSKAASGFARSVEVRLERLGAEMTRRKEAMFMQREGRLEKLSALLRERISLGLVRENARLESAGQMIEGRRPESILALGFAIVRMAGNAIKDSRSVSVGDTLDITLSRGTVKTEVKEKKDKL